MKTFKQISLATLLVVFTSGLFAQNSSKCGTDQYNDMLLNSNPLLRQLSDTKIQEMISRQKKTPARHNKAGLPVYILPVVIHVIYENDAQNISKTQVLNGLATVNRDFRKLNPDTANIRPVFIPYAADCEIEFRLATKDPNGNCTEGIVRVEGTSLGSSQNSSMDMALKNLSRWPVNDYVNIWLVNDIDEGAGATGTTLGYSTLPYSGLGNSSGLVCLQSEWGGANSETGTHELGHFLGLFHTFQNGCGGNCSSTGDYVCDTPPTFEATFTCSNTLNTCSNDASGPDPYNANVLDQVENYMSYDDCGKMFSLGQKALIFDNFVNTGLANLVSAGNDVATGTEDPYVYGSDPLHQVQIKIQQLHIILLEHMEQHL